MGGARERNAEVGADASGAAAIKAEAWKNKLGGKATTGGGGNCAAANNPAAMQIAQASSAG